MRYLYLIIGLLLISSCSERQNERPDTEVKIDVLVKSADTLNRIKTQLDSIYLQNGLVDISSIDPRIIIDLRYATKRNFTGVLLYDSIQAAYLQIDVAKRLAECQNYLDSLRKGYRLKVFDAIRPIEVQWQMWHALDSIPVYRRGKFVSNPRLGSVHNFGSAVDLTICDETGKELDMGAGYDDFREIAFPSLEMHYLRTGELTLVQVENRKLLRKVMRSQGFQNIPSEWWHFNAFSRYKAEVLYPALLTESGKFEKRSRSSQSTYPLNDSIQLMAPDSIVQ